jgi:hypothetical protein
MSAARPLRDVFADLAGDHGDAMAPDVLAAHGHPDLPDGLVAEAVVNYADTAPIEVAQHLAPYVMAHSPVPQPDGDDEPPPWLHALTSAPVVVEVPPDPVDEHPMADHALDLDFGAGDETAPHHHPDVHLSHVDSTPDHHDVHLHQYDDHSPVLEPPHQELFDHDPGFLDDPAEHDPAHHHPGHDVGHHDDPGYLGHL